MLTAERCGLLPLIIMDPEMPFGMGDVIAQVSSMLLTGGENMRDSLVSNTVLSSAQLREVYQLSGSSQGGAFSMISRPSSPFPGGSIRC